MTRQYDPVERSAGRAIATHITEKSTAVADAPGRCIVEPSLGVPGSEALFARAEPADVRPRLRPVVARRIGFRPRHPQSSLDEDTIGEWPGIAVASPITLEGTEGSWGEFILEAPDGTSTSPGTSDRDDEASFRARCLDDLRRASDDATERNPGFGAS